MADWKRGMARTYEFWEVNPSTWGDNEILDTITSCSITRDSDDETLGSATFEMDSWEGERWIRVYLITKQDGVRERWPLGTFMVQVPDRSFDGMRGYASANGYTPLKELADNKPPVAYKLETGFVEDKVARLIETYGRAPVVMPEGETRIQEEFVAEDDESWLSFDKSALAKGKKHIELTPRGEVLIAPDQDPWSKMPSFVFNDSNSSILRPEVQVSTDLSEVPNVVQVVYSKASGCLIGEAVNDDPSSENSTVTLGRRKVYRENSPELPDNPDQEDVDILARKLLREKGAASYEVTFTHGFVPDVNLGTAVRLSYRAMGLDVVAIVTAQTIQCTPACQVQTTARYYKERL